MYRNRLIDILGLASQYSYSQTCPAEDDLHSIHFLRISAVDFLENY